MALAKMQDVQDKIQDRVGRSADMLKKMGIDPGTFERVALNALVINPDLADKCSVGSVQKTVVQAINAGLMLDNREAAIVPRGGHATFIPMIDGLIKLAELGTPGMTLETGVIYTGETWEYERGLESVFRHVPGNGDKSDGAVEAVYAIARQRDRTLIGFEVMFRGEVDRIRGKAATDYVWKDNFPEMCRKSVAKRLLKRMPHGRGVQLPQDDEFDHLDTGVAGYDVVPSMALEARDVQPRQAPAQQERRMVVGSTGEIIEAPQPEAGAERTVPSPIPFSPIDEPMPFEPVDEYPVDDDEDPPF